MEQTDEAEVQSSCLASSLPQSLKVLETGWRWRLVHIDTVNRSEFALRVSNHQIPSDLCEFDLIPPVNNQDELFLFAMSLVVGLHAPDSLLWSPRPVS